MCKHAAKKHNNTLKILISTGLLTVFWLIKQNQLLNNSAFFILEWACMHSESRVLIFPWGVCKWKCAARRRGRECWRSGWERKRQHCFRGSATSKLPAVNQRTRPSPGAALSCSLARGNHCWEKKRTQLNRCRELQVNVCGSMRVCVPVTVFLCTPVDSPSKKKKEKMCMWASAYASVRCGFIWGWALLAYVCLCVRSQRSVSVCGADLWEQPTPEGGEFCLHIDEPASLCPWALHKHHNQLRAKLYKMKKKTKTKKYLASHFYCCVPMTVHKKVT